MSVYTRPAERVVRSGAWLQVFLLILGPPTLPIVVGIFGIRQCMLGNRWALNCLARIRGPISMRLVRLRRCLVRCRFRAVLPDRFTIMMALSWWASYVQPWLVLLH